MLFFILLLSTLFCVNVVVPMRLQFSVLVLVFLQFRFCLGKMGVNKSKALGKMGVNKSRALGEMGVNKSRL